MTVENFLATWNENSDTIENSKRKRLFNVFEVELSKSGRQNTVRLNSIRSTARKSGELKNLMKWLVKQADKNSVTLSMACQSFGFSWDQDELPTTDKLREIAERHKFKVKWEYPDGGYEMAREPKSK